MTFRAPHSRFSGGLIGVLLVAAVALVCFSWGVRAQHEGWVGTYKFGPTMDDAEAALTSAKIQVVFVCNRELPPDMDREMQVFVRAVP